MVFRRTRLALVRKAEFVRLCNAEPVRLCNAEGVREFQPRNYEAGSPKVGLKVGQCPTRYEFDPCGLTQNLTMKGVPGDEDIGIGFREIQDGGLCLRE
jgi:hypothetical protein